MTFDEWVAVGRAHGWIFGDVFCAQHDDPPMTAAEAAELDAGRGRCLPAVRLAARTPTTLAELGRRGELDE